jgi:cytochrome oxidase Cu insertion factor (SCO1/SenC/PrrC family)
MKKRLLIILPVVIMLLFNATQTSAQAAKIPPFRIIQQDGKVFKAEQLPLNKPIIIIYFDPGCDHCQVLVTDLLRRWKDFEKASIAMITFVPVDDLKKFSKDYNLPKYPNIYAGTEGTNYFVRNYFRIVQMPFLALFNKNGAFIVSYTRQVPLDDLKNKLLPLK